MNHERKLFVKEHKDKDEDEQCYDCRSRRWYSHGFEFSLRIPRSSSGNFHPVLLDSSAMKAKTVQGYSIYFIPKVLPLVCVISI